MKRAARVLLLLSTMLACIAVVGLTTTLAPIDSSYSTNALSRSDNMNTNAAGAPSSSSPPPPSRQPLVHGEENIRDADGESDSYLEDTDTFLAETRALIELVNADHALYFEWFNQTLRTKHRVAGSTVHAVKVKSPTRAGTKIMVVCGMHGRELFTSDVCRSWLLYAAASTSMANFTNTAETTSAFSNLSGAQWLYVPVANPSGRDIVTQSYRRQHKLPPRGTESRWDLCHRGNRNGVDLNRNWRTYNEDLYHTNTIPHTAGDDRYNSSNNNNPSTTKQSVEYPGPEAFSEPETVILRNLIEDFRPDLLLSIHTGTLAVLVPYDDTPKKPPLYNDLIRVAEWISTQARCTECIVGRGASALYRARGTMGDFVFRHELCPFPITLEVYKQDDTNENVSDEYNHWNEDPWRCFHAFNPPREGFTKQLKRWKRLWTSLYYMNTAQERFFQRGSL